MATYDVFISYSSTNKSIVDAIAADFELQNIKCFYASRDILPGEEWAKMIKEALEDAPVFVLVLTPASNRSRQVMNEVALAFNAGKTIIPFKLTEDPLSYEMAYYLTRVHWLDALTGSINIHIQELRETVKRALQKAETFATEQGSKKGAKKITGIDLSEEGYCAVVDADGKVVVIPSTEGRKQGISPASVLYNRREKIDERKWSPEEQAACSLLFLNKRAERFFNESISETVISVPLHFSYVQRQSVRDAASIAGLKAVRLVSDPVAGAIAFYTKYQRDSVFLSVVVSDNFFDMAVVDCEEGIVEVLSQDSFPILKGKGNDLAVQTEKVLTTLESRTNERRKDEAFYRSHIRVILIGGDSAYYENVSDSLKQILPVTIVQYMPKDSFAIGAAVLAGKLLGRLTRNFLLLDTLQHTVSIEIPDGKVVPVLSKDIAIPAKTAKVCTTSFDNQNRIDIYIYEGEHSLAKDNCLIGTGHLNRISPAPKGQLQIAFIFEIDANGILEVIAENQETGHRKKIVIQSGYMSKEDIEKSRLFLESYSIDAAVTNNNVNISRKAENTKTIEDFAGNTKGILMQILPVLDNFERALEAASNDTGIDQYLEGFKLIYRQLRKNLEAEGVTEIPSLGQSFDPHLHMAAMHVDDPTTGENVIIEVFQKGYMYKGKVLRCSIVKVAN